ncbi:MAG: NAD-dependent epimerase/dehydratase family protein, partial [Planctomycetota bacterium]
IGGTRRVLEAAAVGRVGKVLFMSSGTAYGAHPGNTRPRTEFDELREEYHFQYSREKREAEFLCRRFARDHPLTTLQIVRPAVVGGPNVSNYLFRLIDKPLAFSIIGHEPELQLVHETDVARALCAILRSDLPGAFNLGGEGGLTAPDCYRILERRPVPMPLAALRALMGAGWRFNVRAVTEAPADFLYFMAYPWTLRTERVQRELGFKFRYTSRQVFDAWRGRNWTPEPERAASASA